MNLMSPIDPYVYPNTDILRNKFGVREPDLLEKIEADYTSMRLREIVEKPISGKFDFSHLCAVHKYIFQDIYDWAGSTRSINIEKAEPVLGGISIEYSIFQDILKNTTTVLTQLQKKSWEQLSGAVRAKTFSKHLAGLWKIHPFRDGNTRTIITFYCQFADFRGFKLDMQLLEENSVFLRNSLVAAAASFHDLGNMAKPQYLDEIIEDAIERGSRLK